MNQAQRNFLIKKIEETTKITVDTLMSGEEKEIDTNNWYLHYVLSDQFEMQPIEKIREIIKQKALNHDKDKYSWMNDDRWGSSKNVISFKPSEIFIVPDELRQKIEKVREHNRKIHDKIAEVQAQSNTLILRIQLASDKTLQAMINEVDDMGNLSLVDAKLKALNK